MPVLEICLFVSASAGDSASVSVLLILFFAGSRETHMLAVAGLMHKSHDHVCSSGCHANNLMNFYVPVCMHAIPVRLE